MTDLSPNAEIDATLSRDRMVQWIAETLRSYEVPDHRAEQIAECFLDEGLCVIPPVRGS